MANIAVKQAGVSTRLREPLFSVWFKTSPLPMWIFDRNSFEFLEVNQAAIRHYGYSREEFLSMAIKNIRPREDVPRLLQFVPHFVADTDFREAGLWRHCKKDGTVIDVEVAAHTFDFGGKRACICILNDVTQRKRFEEALRGAERKYRGMFENAIEGISQTTEDGRILAANPALARIYGYPSPEDFIRSVTDIQKQVYVEAASRAELLRLLREQGAVTGFERQHYRKDGSIIWVQYNARAVRDENGKVLYYEGTFIDITERKRAEEQVRFQASLLDQVRNAVVATDPQLRVIFWNKYAESLYQWKAHEAIGQSVLNLLMPAESQEMAGLIINTLKVKGYREGEFVVQRKDGVRLPVYAVCSAIYDTQREVAGFVSIAFDISERKRAEEALKVSEKRYRLLFERNLAGVVRTTVDGRILECNESFARMFGYSSCQDVTNLKSWDLYFSREERQVFLTRLQEQGTLTNFEVLGRRKDGSPLWALENANWLAHDNGKDDVIEATVIDITERKQAEEALKASERRYRLLFERNLAGVVRTTEDGRILDCNESFARMFGYPSRQDVLNLQSWDLYFRREDREAVVTQLQKQGTLTNIEVLGRRKDGSPVWILGNANLLTYDNLEANVIEKTVFDMTERKQAEDELHKLSGRLLRLQDEERRRIARELHDCVAQSLAALEMNLGVVNESAALLDPRVRSALAESLALAGQCSRETRTISFLLHPPVLDDQGLLSALCEYVEGFAQRSGVPVVIDVPSNLGVLPRDAEMTLYRIAQESLTNINRHSGSSRARICIARTPGQIVLEVSDEGHGISSHDRESAAKGIATLGVGIPSMRERVNQLGGQLEIVSAKCGTTIRVILPLS